MFSASCSFSGQNSSEGISFTSTVKVYFIFASTVVSPRKPSKFYAASSDKSRFLASSSCRALTASVAAKAVW